MNDLSSVISSVIPSFNSLSPDMQVTVSGCVLIVLLSLFSGTLRQILMGRRK